MADQIQNMIEPVINSLDYELVGVKLIGSDRHQTVRVYIDKPDGVTVDDCALVSRQVSAILDVEDPIRGEYMLEVSSPGLDRPIIKQSDFERFKGADVKIKLSFPIENQRNWRGILAGLNDSVVLLDVEGEVVELPFADIKDCRMVPNI